jgi:hypothetical protein
MPMVRSRQQNKGPVDHIADTQYGSQAVPGGTPLVREAYVSRDGKEWLGTVTQVYSHFSFRIQMARRHGPYAGVSAHEPIKKLAGFSDLWEVRVQHGGDQYRLFFKFTPIAGRPAVVVDSGAMKKGRLLPRRVLERADRRLDAYIEALEQDPELRELDRFK